MANFASKYPNKGIKIEELNDEHKYQLKISNISGNTLFKVKRKIIPEKEDEPNIEVSMLSPAEVIFFYDLMREQISPNDNYQLGQTHRPFIDDDDENPYDLYNVVAAVYHLNYVAENYDFAYVVVENEDQVGYQPPLLERCKRDTHSGEEF